MAIVFGGIRAIFRPIGTWPQERTEQPRRSLFSAPWQDTLAKLKYEIERLEPVRTMMQMDLRERDIRNDGLPRADARPSFPGVILSLELEPTRWMHLPCDTFDTWQDNVRAITLTLEALRAIDRYGVSKRGEQYAGWKQIPAVTGGPAGLSLESAAEFLATHAGMSGDPAAVAAIASSASVRAIAFRKAAAKLHPDAGGDEDAFRQLQAAARLLELNANQDNGGMP